MVSELPPRSRWAALGMMWVLAMTPRVSFAQGVSAFDLLSAGPELGGLDVPRELPTVLPASVPPIRIGVEQGLAQGRVDVAPGRTFSLMGDVPTAAGTMPDAAAADVATESGPDTARASVSDVAAAAVVAAGVSVSDGATADTARPDAPVRQVLAEGAESSVPAGSSGSQAEAAISTLGTEAAPSSSDGAGVAAHLPGRPGVLPGPLAPNEGVLSPGMSPHLPMQERPFQVLPVAASVLPGLLFHGLGPLIAGDTHTAKRLFAMEGAGLGLIALGGVPIAFTGASRRTIAPLYAVTLAGFSMFGVSALANLYAVTSPAFDPGVPASSLPPLELELGYQYVSDPSFEYGSFVSVGALARFDSLQLKGSALMAPSEGNTQVRLGGAYRLLGESERARGSSDGTSLDAELFGLYHRYPTEGFTVAGAEVGLRGRYAMARVSPALAGSFAEASLGTSFHGYSYPGAVDDGNLSEQLLFTFGYGVWLGRGGPVRGDALLYYDHRKDDFAGGMRTRGGGVIGSFGLRGRALLTQDWGVAAEVQAGGAVVGRLSLIYAVGGDL
ncbi:hypothetical protein [Pyxidicoccus xibeiensis]|uniref:hypothetical protein n=1 Tax=Pyxidicoccus xibeiensis TaxID=2906759 RepID=UPI0020A70446|nr:hypothetical protein [Pyxidicoccus xibeiensis]MCP3136701.1 hypothetical protein [Pyxidicoccus xibeiensis]